MASVLTSDEEEATKQFLSSVNGVNNGGATVSWTTAVKFLMARKFNVKRAIELYWAHETIRKKEGILSIDLRDECVKQELLSEKFTVLPGKDKSGAAIALFYAKVHRPDQTTHQATLQSLVFQLDVALESIETQRYGLVFIYDMTNSKYQNFDYELSIKILNLLKGSYPARLKKVFIVTAPLWFKAPFKLLRLFVREKLRERVVTVSASQLSQHIAVCSLPPRLGGAASVDHRHWLRHCLASAWGSGRANEVSAYLAAAAAAAAAMTPETSASSLSSSAVSDVDSARSTASEKHTSEGREKTPCAAQKRASTGDAPPASAGGGDDPQPAPRRKRPAACVETQQSADGGSDAGMTIDELVEYSRIKGRSGLCREYAEIRTQPPTGSFDVSRAKVNLPRNRYTDVLCVDQTRVKLDCQNGKSDYINANFVDGYMHKNAYISTQGPLPRTFNDFWTMVWQQMVLLVVMTTKSVERGRLKCGQYWPLDANSAEEYDDFIVVNTAVESRADLTLSALVLQNKHTGESRRVTHLQFTSWPDYGVPHSADAFLRFMMLVREKQAEGVADMEEGWLGHPHGPPIVVHCSAGIGRTGTFITMDISTRRLADVGCVDLRATVLAIRAQRAFSIQMPEQYVFCYLALIEHAQQQGLLPLDLLLDSFDECSDSD